MIKDSQLVVLDIEHKGVTVTVQIDYKLGLISLVNHNGTIYHAKKWNFSGRSIEYMQGWLNILGAMTEAVTIAKSSLETHQLNMAKEKERVLIDVTKNMYGSPSFIGGTNLNKR